MNSLISFFTLYFLLDQCYFACQKNFEDCLEDFLAPFLGAMSPELWEDGMPIDKAILSDWREMYGETEMDEHNAKQMAYDFITDYERQTKLPFPHTKEWLLGDRREEIKRAVEKGFAFYQEYHSNKP